MDMLLLKYQIEKAPEGGYIGYIEEMPGVNTEGETLTEVKENLMDAFLMALGDYHKDKTISLH